MKYKQIEIDGEKVYVKKDFLGWRIVNPIKNEDGSYNYINLIFGGWRNLITLLIAGLIIGFGIYSYYHDINQLKQIIDFYKSTRITIIP